MECCGGVKRLRHAGSFGFSEPIGSPSPRCSRRFEAPVTVKVD